VLLGTSPGPPAS